MDGDTANEVSLVNYFDYGHLRDMGKCFVQTEAYRQRKTSLRKWRNLLNQRKNCILQCNQMSRNG